MKSTRDFLPEGKFFSITDLVYNDYDFYTGQDFRIEQCFQPRAIQWYSEVIISCDIIINIQLQY